MFFFIYNRLYLCSPFASYKYNKFVFGLNCDVTIKSMEVIVAQCRNVLDFQYLHYFNFFVFCKPDSFSRKTRNAWEQKLRNVFHHQHSHNVKDLNSNGIDSCQPALDLNIMFVLIIRNEIHAKRYQK